MHYGLFVLMGMYALRCMVECVVETEQDRYRVEMTDSVVMSDASGILTFWPCFLVILHAMNDYVKSGIGSESTDRSFA